MRTNLKHLVVGELKRRRALTPMTMTQMDTLMLGFVSSPVWRPTQREEADELTLPIKPTRSRKKFRHRFRQELRVFWRTAPERSAAILQLT